MKTVAVSRFALGVSIFALLLAGCGGLPLGSPAASQNRDVWQSGPSRAAGEYRVLFTFNGKNGALPGGLTASDGVLYGTTSSGGSDHAGTFFSLTTSGEEQTLHNFSGKNGSPDQVAGLTLLNGLFYGATDSVCYNAKSRCGAIFSLDASGRERVLHVFLKHRQEPHWLSSLTVLNGVLYGTTADGNFTQNGTVFSLTPSGDFRVIYRFQGAILPSNDGAWPNSIVALNGMLYGTTIYGGKNGSGTIFSITTTGKERVIYSFGSAYSGDGADPNGVVVLHGKLYGTTWAGGNHYDCFGDPPTGCGTVFGVTTAGNEHVLYSFQASAGNPVSGLAALNGKLYGTTGGTLFSITTAGREKTLHTFNACACSQLTALNGTLYGTTRNGGKRHSGSGTVYAFTP